MKKEGGVLSYFGFSRKSLTPKWQRTDVSVDFSVLKGKKLQTAIAKTCIVWAWNIYEFDEEDWEETKKAAEDKKSMTVTMPSYMTVGNFKWFFKYRHKTKDVSEIAWWEWLKLSNRERDDYAPVLYYRTLAESNDGEEPEVLNDMTLTGEKAQKFADAFYELAKPLMGIKLDPTVKDSVKEVPDPEKTDGIELAPITVDDGCGWVLSGEIKIPAEALENITPESQTLLVQSLNRLSKFFANASKAVSNKALKTEKDTGPKKTTLDFVKEAAEKFEKTNPDCKKGYAEEVAKTIDQLLANGFKSEGIMDLLKSSGNHDKILEMAKKLQEEAKKAKPEGDGGSKSGDGDDGGTKVPSEIKLQISWYERAEKNSKDIKEVAKKLPYGWDEEFGKNPTYNEARSSGALKGLPFIELTVFELCLRFLRAGQEVPTDIANFAEEQYKITEEALKHS